MNEVEELLKLDIDSLPKLKPVLFDDLRHKVLKNLYLELGSGQVLYLLSFSYNVINPSPNEVVDELITKRSEVLNFIKEYICRNLTVYSVLLDVNSYFIEQNNFLLLARLRERDSGGRRYEIKYYTHSPLEVVKNYKDKIYIGRDFIDLFQFKRKYFGIKDFITSLKDQNEALLERAEQKMRRPVKYKPFFQEISEYVNELHTESFDTLQSLPPYLDMDKLSGNDLIDINAQYRSINHYLIELRDEVEEFENLLFKSEVSYVRYVTKYKKDIANLISYFNIKINGSLSEKIYRLKTSR
jgi:hypothetical protein